MNATVPLCAKKCDALPDCLAFEVYDAPTPACYVFKDTLAAPFKANPDCITCVKVARAREEEDRHVWRPGRTQRRSAAAVAVRILASGYLPEAFGLKTWRRVSLSAMGCRLVASVDGAVVADVNDAGCSMRAGWGAVGTGWHAAQFKEVGARQAGDRADSARGQ